MSATTTVAVGLRLQPDEVRRLDSERAGMTRADFARRVMRYALGSPKLLDAVREEYGQEIDVLLSAGQPSDGGAPLA